MKIVFQLMSEQQNIPLALTVAKLDYDQSIEHIFRVDWQTWTISDNDDDLNDDDVHEHQQ